MIDALSSVLGSSGVKQPKTDYQAFILDGTMTAEQIIEKASLPLYWCTWEANGTTVVAFPSKTEFKI